MKHIYAIGMKNWVELREADKPPKSHYSEVILEQPGKGGYTQGHWENHVEGLDIYHPGHYKRVGPLKITTTVYTGGKVLTSLKSRKFSRLLKIHVGAGGLVALSPEHVEVLIEKGLIDVKHRQNLSEPAQEAVEQRRKTAASQAYSTSERFETTR